MSAAADARAQLAEFVALSRAANYAAALPLIEALTERFPTEGLLHLHRARTLLALGDPLPARLAAEQAGKLAPNDARVAEFLATLARYAINKAPALSTAPADDAAHYATCWARIADFLAETDADESLLHITVSVVLKLAISAPPRLEVVSVVDADMQARIHAVDTRLQQRGYTALGWFRARHDELRAWDSPAFQCWLDAGATTLASAWVVRTESAHWHDRLWLRWQKRHRILVALEAQSQLSDGTLLCTNNLGGSLAFGDDDGAELNKLNRNASVAAVARAHRDALSRHRGQCALALPVDPAELADHLRLTHARRAAARRLMGVVSDAELKRFLGSHYAKLAGPVRRKLAQLLDGTDLARRVVG